MTPQIGEQLYFVGRNWLVLDITENTHGTWIKLDDHKDAWMPHHWVKLSDITTYQEGL